MEQNICNRVYNHSGQARRQFVSYVQRRGLLSMFVIIFFHRSFIILSSFSAFSSSRGRINERNASVSSQSFIHLVFSSSTFSFSLWFLFLIPHYFQGEPRKRFILSTYIFFSLLFSLISSSTFSFFPSFCFLFLFFL